MSTSPTTQSKKTLVTIGKASEILGVSIDTIRRWDKAGLIKAYREERAEVELWNYSSF